MLPEVSIITVHYNTPLELLNLRDSIGKTLQTTPHEWIVVDNHSDEDLSNELASSVYLRQPKNYGFGKACNIAASRAVAPHLFFVNPDCVFVENCIPELVSCLQHSGVCGPLVLNSDGTIQLSFGPELSIPTELFQKMRMRMERTALFQSRLRKKTSRMFHPDYVSGCALMVSRNLFNAVGGFDESFFLYEEDVDLCKRIRQRGHRVTFVPSAKIMHHRNRSTGLHSSTSRREYRRSQLRYYRKHKGKFQQMFLEAYLSATGEYPRPEEPTAD